MSERNHLLSPPSGTYRHDSIESLLCPVPGQIFLFDDLEKEVSRDPVRGIIESTEAWTTRAVA